MLSISSLTFFFVLFSNNFLENFALKRETPLSACEFISSKPVPYPTPSPTNVDTNEAVLVHPFSSVINQNAIFSPFQIINTGYSLEYRPNPIPTSTRTYGGVMCNSTYLFHSLGFYQTKDLKGRSYTTINGVGTPLTLIQYYVKKEYGTFENALKYRDGLVIQIFPFIFSPKDNPLFYPVELAISLIRKPGSYVYLPSAIAYLWFDRLPFLSKYYAFYGSYIDQETGKQYESAIIIVAARPIPVISKRQYIRSFLTLRDKNGQVLDNAAPLKDFGKRDLLKAYGLKQLVVPF